MANHLWLSSSLSSSSWRLAVVTIVLVVASSTVAADPDEPDALPRANRITVVLEANDGAQKIVEDVFKMVFLNGGSTVYRIPRFEQRQTDGNTTTAQLAVGERVQLNVQRLADLMPPPDEPVDEEKQNRTNYGRLAHSRFCSDVLHGSLLVILVSEQNNVSKRMRHLAYTLALYDVPVVSVGERSDWKQLSDYPSMIRMLPTWSSQADIMHEWLSQLDYRTLGMVTTPDPESSAFQNRWHEVNNRQANKKITIAKTILLGAEPTWPTYVEQMNEANTNIWMIDTDAVKATEVFQKLAPTQPSAVWFVSERARNNSVPYGALCWSRSCKDAALRANHTDMQHAVTMALLTTRHALDSLNGALTDNLLSSECRRKSQMQDRAAFLRSHHKHDLRTQLLDTQLNGTYNVRFDRDGNRRSAVYQLLNLLYGAGNCSANASAHRQCEKPVGDYNPFADSKERSALYFDEAAVVWPGNSSVRPSDVALPDHLQRTTYVPCAQLGKPDGEQYCCAGLAIDMLLYVRTAPVLPFSYGFNLTFTATYGSINQTVVQWSGMVGSVVRGETDVAIGALSINQERQNDVDFTIPWLYHGIAILEKYKTRESPLQSFLQPFQAELWVSLVGCVFAVGFAMFLLDRHSPFVRYPVNTINISEDDEDERPLGLSGALWFVWGVLLDSGIGERSPRGLAARVLGMTWCAFSAIMVASYTANLAAFLVLDQPHATLTGIEDTRLRNPSANFTFATVKYSNTHSHFKRHIELQTMSRMMEDRNYLRAAEAIQAVKNGSLNAFIWDSTYLDHAASQSCDLGISGSTFGGSAYGIALQKDSPWTRLFSLAVLHLIENGTIEDLENKWIYNESTPVCAAVDNTPVRLGLINMKDLFILVAAGIGFGVCLALFERRLRLYRLAKAELTAGGAGGDRTGRSSSSSHHVATQVMAAPRRIGGSGLERDADGHSDVWLLPPSLQTTVISSNVHGLGAEKQLMADLDRGGGAPTATTATVRTGGKRRHDRNGAKKVNVNESTPMLTATVSSTPGSAHAQQQPQPSPGSSSKQPQHRRPPAYKEVVENGSLLRVVCTGKDISHSQQPQSTRTDRQPQQARANSPAFYNKPVALI